MDHSKYNRFQQIPWITYTNVLICILVYIHEVQLAHNLLTVPTSILFKLGGVLSCHRNSLSILKMCLLQIINPRNWEGMWLHAGLIHITSNMIILLLVGSLVEPYFGHLRFALIYLFSGFIGDVMSGCLTTNAITIGASGAIFGITLAGFSLKFIFKGDARVAAIAHNLILLFVLNLACNLGETQIALLAHIGGALTGFVLGLALRPNVTINNSKLAHNIIIEFIETLFLVGLLLFLLMMI